MRFQNPDPKKYVIKIRKGQPILVDKQILRWRAANKKRVAVQNPPVELDARELLRKGIF